MLREHLCQRIDELVIASIQSVQQDWPDNLDSPLASNVSLNQMLLLLQQHGLSGLDRLCQGLLFFDRVCSDGHRLPYTIPLGDQMGAAPPVCPPFHGDGSVAVDDSNCDHCARNVSQQHIMVTSRSHQVTRLYSHRTTMWTTSI